MVPRLNDSNDNRCRSYDIPVLCVLYGGKRNELDLREDVPEPAKDHD